MSLAAGLRLLLKPSGPLGYEKPFYMPDASLFLTRGDVNFQIDSNLEASVALQIMFLICISVAGDLKLRHSSA